jgi:hypothetical protein
LLYYYLTTVNIMILTVIKTRTLIVLIHGFSYALAVISRASGAVQGRCDTNEPRTTRLRLSNRIGTLRCRKWKPYGTVFTPAAVRLGRDPPVRSDRSFWGAEHVGQRTPPARATAHPHVTSSFSEPVWPGLFTLVNFYRGTKISQVKFY